MNNNFRERIFSIQNQSEFTKTAIDVFSYQYENNTVYREFANHLKRSPAGISRIEDIPFLPVELFRNHIILSARFPVDIIFESSGTTDTIPGRHFVKDLGLYEESFLRAFRQFYGEPEDFIIGALLPSYTERRGSSLVYMANTLIKRSNNELSGFYKDDVADFIRKAGKAKGSDKKVLLLGVSFALLDLAEKHSPDLSGFTVMETGGMKGRRKEITRAELHEILRDKFNLTGIHSEYGMTELMSQAYSGGNGIFHSPAWMKVLIRDPQDPLTIYEETGRTGGINLIDLANLNSCSFLATSDLGKLNADGGFEVTGRFDNSDIRGCNLMVL
jgi:phenylacetate-coenzyme A ligase PaaK-like adenylate-forming protein